MDTNANEQSKGVLCLKRNPCAVSLKQKNYLYTKNNGTISLNATPRHSLCSVLVRDISSLSMVVPFELRTLKREDNELKWEDNASPMQRIKGNNT